MDEYHISEIPERFLMTQHYQSSMDQPNLDNVQAKLHVARQRNHELAMQYFRNKYGSAAAYEDFAKKHNMGELIEQQPTAQQALISHLERKAKQIQKHVHQEESYEEDKYPGKEPEWLKKHAKKGTNNPWMKSKSPQKNGRKKTEQSIYVDSALAPKNKETQFVSEFKNYLEHKEKVKQSKKEQLDASMNKSMGKSLNKTTQSKLLSTSKPDNKTSVQGEKKKCYEEELAKKIFKDISGETKDSSSIQKLALVEYIVKNKKILKVLGITEQALSTQIMSEYPTKIESQMSLVQLTYYILKTLGKQKQINQLKQQKRIKDVPEGCMLSKEMIHHFEKVFKQMDKHTDLIIRRLPYIDRLANDPLIKNQLNSPAVLEPEIGRPVALRRIFERIEMECLFGDESQQKVKEYISWNQFLDYFKSGYSSQSVYNLISLVDSLHKSDALGLMEVPEVVIQIIMEVVTSMPSKSGYFNTQALIQAITSHQEYEHEKYTQVRSQSRIAGLPLETLEEVLLRTKQNGDKFMTLKQFLEYFSAKGRPIELFQQQKIHTAKKNFSGVKIKFASNQININNQQVDGYDSDPQIYQSKVMKQSPRKSGLSSKKLQQPNSFIEDAKKQSSGNRKYKVTVPVPFSFEERSRELSKEKNLKKTQSEREQFKHFKAKPIPENLLEQGLYEKMIEQDRIKIEDRKKSSMILTLANERPFSFMNRKANKKTKEEREQFVFKAKPIPWYCSVDLLQKKKEAEIVRNEKIAKEAQQNLAKAKLPPRMERDYQQKQAKLANAEYERIKRPQSQPKTYKEPPNFEKLHKQFEQGLERRRKQNKTTKPQQFNFTHKTSKGAVASSQTQDQFYKEQGKEKADYKKIFENKVVAPSTAKFEQLVEKRRQEMDKKRKEEEEKRIEDQKWKKIDEDLKNKLLAATKNKENKEEKERQQRETEMKQQMKNFQEWKKKCVEKGRSQPMLIERPLKRDQKIEKMKKLYQISQTLKGNGIKGKDHDSYFKREELLMLQDYEILKTTLNEKGM